MKITDRLDDLESMTPNAPSSIGESTRLRRRISSTELAGSFGRTLREERRKRKLTLSHLASQSGMSASYLSRIEHGQLPPPSAKIMHRLAMALNIEISAFKRRPVSSPSASLQSFARDRLSSRCSASSIANPRTSFWTCAMRCSSGVNVPVDSRLLEHRRPGSALVFSISETVNRSSMCISVCYDTRP